MRLIISFTGISIFFIGTQSIQIFPGALFGLMNSSERDVQTLPKGVESIFVKTSDGEKIELWKLAVPKSKKVALIFHGNAGDIANFFPYQKYFNY